MNKVEMRKIKDVLSVMSSSYAREAVSILDRELARIPFDGYEILVNPVVVEGVPDAHNVVLKAGPQHFPVGLEYWRTKDQARWYSLQLEYAMREVAEPYSSQDDMDDAKLYRWLKTAPLSFKESLIKRRPDDWEEFIAAAIKEENDD